MPRGRLSTPEHDVSWPVNHIRIQARRHSDGRWTLRCSGFVNGEYRSELHTVDAEHLVEGTVAAMTRFEHVYRTELS